jgi:hypothetical protein
MMKDERIRTAHCTQEKHHYYSQSLVLKDKKKERRTPLIAHGRNTHTHISTTAEPQKHS